MLKLVTAPNPILTTPTKKVEKIDRSVLDLVGQMEKTLIAQTDPKGVGLAATQIGHGISLFIMKPSAKVKTEVMINPRIIEHRTWSMEHGAKKEAQIPEKKKKQPLEGCLSIPKIWSPVKRSDKVLVEYMNLTGKIHRKWFSGLRAVIVQHEVDHLNGVLFTQRALEQNEQMFEEKDGKLKKLKY